MLSHVLLVFIDGLGVGACTEHNPLAGPSLDDWNILARGKLCGDIHYSTGTWLVKTIDANLDVDGLPQSGTGQASLFTGINCAKILGRHHGPRPHSSSSQIIRSSNVFQRLIDKGITADELAFANAYPSKFFRYAKKHNRWTATTQCCLAAGIKIRSTRELINGAAVSADLTRERFSVAEPSVPMISCLQAGRDLAALTKAHRLTLFEYYATDKAGHSMDYAKSIKALGQVGELIRVVVEAVNLKETLILVTSDHGNIEDLSTKTHTRNPVPLLAIGKGAGAFDSVNSILGVVPKIVSLVMA